MNARDQIAIALDGVAKLPPGSGQLTGGLLAHGRDDPATVGLFADASYRVNQDLAAFARGELGYVLSDDERLAWSVLDGAGWGS